MDGNNKGGIMEIIYMKFFAGILAIFFAVKFLFSLIDQIEYHQSFEYLVIGVDQSFSTIEDFVLAVLFALVFFI